MTMYNAFKHIHTLIVYGYLHMLFVDIELIEYLILADITICLYKHPLKS